MNQAILTYSSQKKLKGVAFSILRNTHDAEDVVQEVMLSLYSNPKILDDLEMPYVIACVRNHAINMLRTLRNRREVRPREAQEVDESDTEFHTHTGYNSTPEKELIQGQELTRGLQALGELPQGVKDVFILKEAVGYTCKEISQHLDVSYDTVKDRLKKARRSIGEGERSTTKVMEREL